MKKEDAILDMLELLHHELRDMDGWVDSGEHDPIVVLRKQIADAAKEGANQQAWDDLQKGLAKGLPELTKGIINATQSFQGGDPFSGSAAIMDICATLTSTIASIAPAAGPPGAVVAALFQVFSMILNLFAPKAESLTSQLEKLMRELAAEEKAQQIDVAQKSIRVYANSAMSSTPASLKNIVKMLNPVEGNTVWAIREVAKWLEEKKNQGLKSWGQVLAAQCQAYADLVRVAHKDLTKLKLTAKEETDGLKNAIGAFITTVESNQPIQLEFLQRMVPAAQNRGTVWHLGTRGPGALYGRDFAIGKPDWKCLEGQHRIMAVANTRGAEKSPTPTLAIFGLEAGDVGSLDLNKPFWRNNRTYSLCGRWPLDSNDGWRQVKDQHGDLTGCYDIFAIPGADADQVYVYTANGNTTRGYIHSREDHKASGDRLVHEARVGGFDVPARLQSRRDPDRRPSRAVSRRGRVRLQGRRLDPVRRLRSARRTQLFVRPEHQAVRARGNLCQVPWTARGQGNGQLPGALERLRGHRRGQQVSLGIPIRRDCVRHPLVGQAVRGLQGASTGLDDLYDSGIGQEL